MKEWVVKRVYKTFFHTKMPSFYHLEGCGLKKDEENPWKKFPHKFPHNRNLYHLKGICVNFHENKTGNCNRNILFIKNTTGRKQLSLQCKASHERNMELTVQFQHLRWVFPAICSWWKKDTVTLESKTLELKWYMDEGNVWNENIFFGTAIIMVTSITWSIKASTDFHKDFSESEFRRNLMGAPSFVANCEARQWQVEENEETLLSTYLIASLENTRHMKHGEWKGFI